MNDIKERIKAHEGYRLEPYHCTEGHLTGGWGHKILGKEVVPTSQDGWENLFNNDFEKAFNGANSLIGEHLENTEWSELPEPKKHAITGVLTEMCFQLGQAGVGKFKKMFSALGKCDFKEAASQMKDSRWNKQTPARCLELSGIIQNL